MCYPSRNNGTSRDVSRTQQNSNATLGIIVHNNTDTGYIADMIKNDEISLIINTTEGTQAIADSGTIRSNALQHKVTYTTTLAGADAMCSAMEQGESSVVNRLQDLHQEIRA